MSIPRFYCPPPLDPDTFFELPEDAAHHALRVLRLRVKDPVELFDGEGKSFAAAIRETSGKRVWLEGVRLNREEPSPQLSVALAQAMASAEKMDWVVQKATELGAAEIRPVQTRRSVAKLDAERAEKRVAHWRSVMIGACEQCGRNRLPEVSAPEDFMGWLASMRDAAGVKFILHPEGGRPLHQQPKPEGRVTILIGPEGGFEAEEIEMARLSGFSPVTLGPRVLRTETAALAAIAALQTLWGDFV
jgi:16S rRNA (uracil1498-N3)-methyltransferase